MRGPKARQPRARLPCIPAYHSLLSSGQLAVGRRQFRHVHSLGGCMSCKGRRLVCGTHRARRARAGAAGAERRSRLQARVRELPREDRATRRRRDVLRQMTPEAIFNALTLGRMQIQAISLSATPSARRRGVPRPARPFAPVVAAGRREPLHRDRRRCATRRAPADGTAGATASPTRASSPQRTAGSPPPICRS